ncbi:hypothetical protein P8605_50340, partial [Streptomyces sp. T-3]|nr:hypothetical protein [Streptomyces sp. T-3]
GRRRVPARVSAAGRRLCVAVPYERGSSAPAEQPVSVALDPYTELTLRLSLDSPTPEHDRHLEDRHG